MVTVTSAVLLFCVSLCACDEPEVFTELGKIVGIQIATPDKTPVYRFLGIPYAKPPIGELRFQEPQPRTEKYKDYLLARYPYRCVQYLRNINLVTGEEDCLYLNIYTTSLSAYSNHDVLVFIHGGGFMYGAGHSYTPEFLLEANKELVYVSINYRLGVFGFLSTEDKVVPGNMGLKDQAMALKWIKNNIVLFGGNPDKVVLMGNEAGATSVHLHYLSPMSRELFSHGISMSGGALSVLFQSNNPQISTETLARLTKCTTRSSSAMVSCLRKIDAKDLVQKLVSSHLLPWDRFHNSAHFGPVVEKNEKTAFINQHPYYTLLEGKSKVAPWLITATSGEGEKTASLFINNEKKLAELNTNWEKVAPYLLIFSENCDDKFESSVSQQIRQHYFGTKAISQDTRRDLVDVLGDRLHMTDIEKCVRLHASSNSDPVYFYIFNYQGKYNVAKIFADQTHNDLGVSHLDDLIYILGLMDIEPLMEDSNMVKEMVEILTNFIKNGIPSSTHSPEWPEISHDILHSGEIHFVRIKAPDDIQLEVSEDISHRQFWDSLSLNELHLSGDEMVPDSIKAQKTPYQDKSLINRFADLFGF